MKKMLFLFNPRSGKEQIKSHLLRILDIFSKAGYDIHVHVTQCQLDARKTVEHLGKNVDVIVCSGGDGTLNETISGMLQLKKTPSLGYIPAGSTNDFASSLKISKNMEKAEENLRYATLGFREGVIATSNVLEAQTAWLSAQSEKIDAQIDVKLTEIYLKKSLGTLQ